jgi:hypothetical protein
MLGRERSDCMIPTRSSQPMPSVPGRGGRRAAGTCSPGRGGREAGFQRVPRADSDGRWVIEMAEGIAVYAARRQGIGGALCGTRTASGGSARWRMAAGLEKVALRLAAGAPNMLRIRDELIAFYLSAGPAARRAAVVA